MTFGRPRFNDNYDYEIIRFAWDNSVKVVGGASKMFRHFIDKYNPSSVLTYSDISKFTGNVYLSIGFRPCDIPFSEPGYVWVGSNNNIVLSRYQTQKHKLIEEWIGTKEQTEDEIMKSHNFLKIYDSGNLRLEWNR